MSSLNVQSPSGLTRNLTEVYIFLRNSAQQSHSQVEFGTGGISTLFCGFILFIDSSITDEDRLQLIRIDGEKGSVTVTSKTPPSWINILDEINYEMTR